MSAISVVQLNEIPSNFYSLYTFSNGKQQLKKQQQPEHLHFTTTHNFLSFHIDGLDSQQAEWPNIDF